MIDPKLPTQCGWCEEKSPKTMSQAIAAGWFFTVFSTKKHGQVQLVGCPKHKTSWERACRSVLDGGLPPQAESSEIANEIKGFVEDLDQAARAGKRLLDRFKKPEVPPDDR